jgi:hypothetical protein
LPPIKMQCLPTLLSSPSSLSSSLRASNG